MQLLAVEFPDSCNSCSATDTSWASSATGAEARDRGNSKREMDVGGGAQAGFWSSVSAWWGDTATYDNDAEGGVDHRWFM